MPLPGRVSSVVGSSLELAQAQPLDQLPCCTVILALSNNRISKMKSGSFPALGLPERPPWSILPPEAMYSEWSVLLPQAVMKSDGHVGVCGLC